jgi:hypothetical protein
MITKTEVSLCRRLRALPRYFPNCYIEVEQMVYSVTEMLCAAYRGGYWDFWTLSNGGFFMSPSKDMCLSNTMNQSEEFMSAEAAGIVICIFAYSWLSENNFSLVDKLYTQIDLLKAYAETLPEGGKIFRLID